MDCNHHCEVSRGLGLRFSLRLGLGFSSFKSFKSIFLKHIQLFLKIGYSRICACTKIPVFCLPPGPATGGPNAR